MQKAPFPTDSSINLATRIARDRAKQAADYAQKLATDPQREKRMLKHFCAACYYAPARLAGAAMTTRDCACCGTPQLYVSTNTDPLCPDCAVAHSLCKHCGGDINMSLDRIKPTL